VPNQQKRTPSGCFFADFALSTGCDDFTANMTQFIFILFYILFYNLKMSHKAIKMQLLFKYFELKVLLTFSIYDVIHFMKSSK